MQKECRTFGVFVLFPLFSFVFVMYIPVPYVARNLSTCISTVRQRDRQTEREREKSTNKFNELPTLKIIRLCVVFRANAFFGGEFAFHDR